MSLNSNSPSVKTLTEKKSKNNSSTLNCQICFRIIRYDQTFSEIDLKSLTNNIGMFFKIN